MKKILFILTLFISVSAFGQDSVYYQYELQGNGVDSWVKSEFTNGVKTNKFMVYENPNSPKWKELKLALFSSPLYLRAITEANPNAYSTLLKLMTDGENGDASEQTFLVILNMLGMTFSDLEKAELNGYFEANNFTIRL